MSGLWFVAEGGTIQSVSTSPQDAQGRLQESPATVHVLDMAKGAYSVVAFEGRGAWKRRMHAVATKMRNWAFQIPDLPPPCTHSAHCASFSNRCFVPCRLLPLPPMAGPVRLSHRPGTQPFQHRRLISPMAPSPPSRAPNCVLFRCSRATHLRCGRSSWSTCGGPTLRCVCIFSFFPVRGL